MRQFRVLLGIPKSGVENLNVNFPIEITVNLLIPFNWFSSLQRQTKTERKCTCAFLHVGTLTSLRLQTISVSDWLKTWETIKNGHFDLFTFVLVVLTISFQLCL